MAAETPELSSDHTHLDALLPKAEPEDLVGSPKPWGLSFRSSKKFILVVCVAGFTDTFLYTLIIPIIPNTLIDRAGVSPDDVQEWISIFLGMYGAASLLSSLTIGHLADRAASRRGPLLLALCTLTASTTMYSFGTTPLVLVAARALQGASGSVVHVVGIALLTDTMGPKSSGESMGWQSIAMLAGIMLGPSVGGLVFNYAGHFAVFGMAFVVLGLDILLRFVMIEEKCAEQWVVKKDFVSYGTIDSPSTTADGSAVIAADDQAHNSGNLEAAISATQSTDASSSDSAPPGAFALLSNPRLLLALWAALVCGVLMTALESVLPLYTQSLFDWNPGQSGLLFMLLSPSFLVGPYVDRLTDRNGPRTISLLGWFLGTAIWLSFCAVTNNTLWDKILLYLLMLLFGLSSGLIYTPNLVEVSHAVDEMAQKSEGGFKSSEVIARAYSFHSIAYGVGAIVGPFWGGLLTEKLGWSTLCISLVAANVIGASLTYCFSGGVVEKIEGIVENPV